MYVHKKRSCFDVSGSTSAVAAMKMLQDLFCICDDCKNGVKCLQCVAQKEYLFLACHHGHLHEPYPSHGEHMVVLRSEIPSSICAKLRTVAASNNRVHIP